MQIIRAEARDGRQRDKERDRDHREKDFSEPVQLPPAQPLKPGAEPQLPLPPFLAEAPAVAEQPAARPAPVAPQATVTPPAVQPAARTPLPPRRDAAATGTQTGHAGPAGRKAARADGAPRRSPSCRRQPPRPRRQNRQPPHPRRLHALASRPDFRGAATARGPELYPAIRSPSEPSLPLAPPPLSQLQASPPSHRLLGRQLRRRALPCGARAETPAVTQPAAEDLMVSLEEMAKLLGRASDKP